MMYIVGKVVVANILPIIKLEMRASGLYFFIS